MNVPKKRVLADFFSLRLALGVREDGMLYMSLPIRKEARIEVARNAGERDLKVEGVDGAILTNINNRLVAKRGVFQMYTDIR